MMLTINLKDLYGETAKLDKLDDYCNKVIEMVTGESTPYAEDVTLTGQAPVWLYLKVAHSLHGLVRSLYYDSPVTGKVMIFNHNPR